MPVQTSYPGVYVQEVPSGVRTIAAVSTSITVFLGQAVWGPANKPVLCTSYTDFSKAFTDAVTQGDLARSVRLFFLNGGTTCYVLRVAREGDTTAANNVAAATVTLKDTTNANTLIITAKHPGVLGNSIRATVEHHASDPALFTLKLYREVVNILGITEVFDLQTWTDLSMDPTSRRYALRAVNSDWAVLSQSTANTKRPKISTGTVLAGGSNGINVAATDYDAAYLVVDKELNIFNLMVLPRNNSSLAHKTLWPNASTFCESRRAFLLMDPEDGWNSVITAIDPTTGVNSLRTGLSKQYSAIFFPKVTVREGTTDVQLGASGAMAGLMARIDGTRGVWKAPAGTEADLRGVAGVQYKFTDRENGMMNPRGINTIRLFPNGIVNWGARTMDGDDDFASEYKYIPIRRTALFIEESLFRGLKWVVFEPNDEPLWAQIRLNVGAFMHNLFRQGAFQGTTKQQAYFVKCDAETTTQTDRNMGVVNIWVGFAPLKPAEFVVLYLQQIAGQIQI